MSTHDAVVVGAGPNGLAAAITLAEAGRKVLVLEANEDAGGGARSAELTLPGVVHDVCSAVHPMAVGSPFFSGQPLAAHGLEWIHPPVPLAHPLDGGRAAALHRSLEETVAELGRDGDAWGGLFGPLAGRWDALVPELLAPLHLPSHPLLMARFGLKALRSAAGLARSRFRGEEARALFAGLAAHSFLPLDRPASAAVGLVLGAAGHAVGWPIPRGGSGRIAGALVGRLRELGGELETGRRVRSLEELPDAATVLLDLTPRQVVAVAGDVLPSRYAGKLRDYRYGPGAFKVDWVLDGPIPWEAEICARAGTVHLGGTLEEVEASEAPPWRGEVAERPFVLLAQPSRFDPSRAPEGRDVVWAYCHVPHAFQGNVTDRIEAQVERFAPGFTDRIVARSVLPPAELEARNANLVGGDINGGVQDLGQLFFRPVARRTPYATPVDGLYLCSASTPPGGGVHGMCGYHAARAALKGR